jgi:hypothetical protein
MKELDEFFTKLASRLRKETALSDITYAALETIPGFKTDFAQFFHRSIPCGGDIEVFREYRLKSGGQPDFVFQLGKSWDLIVENKIWDENCHFDEYGVSPIRDRIPTKVALIAVRQIQAPPHCAHWEIRTWAEFLERFEQQQYDTYTVLFKAYLKYARKVCSMAEFEKFKIDANAMGQLTQLSRMIERALNSSPTGLYKIIVKEEHKYNFGDSWAGYFFDLASRRGNGAVSLQVWFGLDFSSEHAPTEGKNIKFSDAAISTSGVSQVERTRASASQSDLKICSRRLSRPPRPNTDYRLLLFLGPLVSWSLSLLVPPSPIRVHPRHPWLKTSACLNAPNRA